MSTLARYLAAGVPLPTLASAPLRKLRRRVSRSREGVLAPDPDEVLRALGAADGDALAAQLARTAGGLVAPRAAVASALPRLFPGEVERALARAEDAARGRLRVFGQAVDARRPGGGWWWGLEPFAVAEATGGGGDAAPQPAGAGPRRAARALDERLRAARAADPKLAWAVGRGDAWLALACGAATARDRASRFAEAYAASVADFARRNPPGEGLQWASPMEAALRALVLGQAHALLAPEDALRDPRYALDLARLAVATGRLVEARLEDDLVVPNNHLVAGHVGLLACAALLPGWPEAPRWRAAGARGLSRALLAQTHAEGTSFEGSVPYHRLALELFTAGALLAARAGSPLGPRAWARLARMYGAARALLHDGRFLPQLGDDDAGRAFAFRERPALDAAYLLPLGAALLRDPAIRVRGGAEGGEEALWLLGPAALEGAGALPPGPPPRSASFPGAGVHALRAGAVELALSCGRHGQRGVGGHSHADALAFELRVGGRLVVCDPGSPTYTGDLALRDRFRGTRAHATVVVDGADQSPLPRGRPFALPDAARARLTRFDPGPPARAAGVHRGYARVGALHHRDLRVSPEAVVVVDALAGRGDHEVELRFPFPDEEVRLRPLAAAEADEAGRLLAEAGLALDAGRAVEVGPAEAPLAILAVASSAPLRLRLEPAAYSPGYGELRPSTTAVLDGRLRLPAVFASILLLAAPGAPPGRARPSAER